MLFKAVFLSKNRDKSETQNYFAVAANCSQFYLCLF